MSQEYESLLNDFNFGTTEYLKEEYPDTVTRSSDHSLGFETPTVAIKSGTRVVDFLFQMGL